MAVSKHFSGRSVVRWGIIGCGDVTEVKSGPGFQLAARSQLVAVMRRNGALAADYAQRHHVPRWYDDAAALIADPEVDAVYIATPPDSHADYAVQVAAAGKPAYVEKPMARNVPECDRMITAFAEANLPLFVAYYRRCQPRFLKANELIKSGALGQITSVTYYLAESHHLKPASWRVDATASGGGHFLDVGSHALDLLDFLVGPLDDVSGSASRTSHASLVEDVVSAKFIVSGGAMGSLVCNFASAARHDELRITGTLGEIACGVFATEPLQFSSAAGVQRFDLPNPKHVAQPLIQTVVDDLLGLEECPSTGTSARRTTRVMDQVLSAYYGGRHDAFWERPDTWPGITGAEI